MKGAIIGDIAGSVYEFDNYRSKDIELFAPHPVSGEEVFFTDDTVLTCAVAQGMMNAYSGDADLQRELTREMQRLGRCYPHAGYGGRFCAWLASEEPEPYMSWGNGAPMRCSPAGMIAGSAGKAYKLGELTAMPSHNHPEALKAAGLTAELIWRAAHNESMEQLRERALELYDLPVIDELRPYYEFSEASASTMPAALSAFFESKSFEDAIKTAISVGGDSDTIAAITGGIAEAYYGVPEELWEQAKLLLDEPLLDIVNEFYRFAADVRS